MQKVFIYILSFTLTASLICNIVFQHRLGKTRQQLEYIRMELDRSTDNYKSIADSVRRTAEILSESATTVQDLRKQIFAIRENYELLESYVNSLDGSM